MNPVPSGQSRKCRGISRLSNAESGQPLASAKRSDVCALAATHWIVIAGSNALVPAAWQSGAASESPAIEMLATVEAAFGIAYIDALPAAYAI
ncbi:hypothetical protein [Massilia niabensis]|uniref:Uncharacterized protein n=1 Tax=Massilia niabensis TaxID=544910 RepID=A0ABW0L6B7_9BURK